MRTFAIVAALAACGTVNEVTPGGGSNEPIGGAITGEQSESSSGSGSGSGSPTHPYNQLFGSVHDERGDTIDFSTGEPVHTHAGPVIDLSTTCPAVYKYAYLMDESDPMFGRQVQTNPLAWHVTPTLSPLDDSASAYRVRASDDSVLLDWTALAADDQGVYTVELHRNGTHPIAALGTTTGQMTVDVRFRDTAGNEMVASACWEHHPLAAPLEVASFAPSDLFQMSLPAHSAISTLMESGVAVVSAPVIQQVGEPVTIALTGSPTGNYTRTIVNDYLPGAITRTSIACSTSPSTCDMSPASNLPSDVATGAIGQLAHPA